MSQNSIHYCICRSKDGKGFMIGCDRCEEWFHGKCIGIKKKAADRIDKYYCASCIKANPALRIVYVPSPPPSTLSSQPSAQSEKKTVSIKHEPLEERKQEKKAAEKNVTTSTTTAKANKSKIAVAKRQQTKVTNPNKRRVNQKTKSKGQTRRQCAHLDCIYEAKQDSKYCSPDCGYNFNKIRYETHFIPKWNKLEQNHSQARLKKMKDLDQLENDKRDLEQLIKNLRLEKDEMEQNIKIIKEIAKNLHKENENSKENDDDDDVEMDNDDPEITSGDASKIPCVICGAPIIADNTFRHWTQCHKKMEDLYNFTADFPFKHYHCDEDPEPKLYCHQQDKKTKRYCMNLESACPQHLNWLSDKDEVCGCPLKIMQKLVPDGNYCLELKRNCNQHFHWDRFRLAQINSQRVQAFSRWDSVIDQSQKIQQNLEDTYGGVVGVMLHNTVNHRQEKEGIDKESPYDQEEVNVDMTME